MFSKEERSQFIKERFNNFDKSFVDWDKPRISISSVIEMVSPEFDKVGVATKCSSKGYDDPNSKWYHMTPDMILESWEAKAEMSKRYGRLVDDYSDLLYNPDTDIDKDMWMLENDYDNDSRLKAHCNAMEQFYDRMMKSGDIEWITREQMLYIDVNSKIGYVRGRLDALFYNKRLNKYIIVDWKSNESIETDPTRWTEKLYGPMREYPKMSWWTYSLQLHTYKLALLKHYLPQETNPDDVSCMIVNAPMKGYSNKHAVIGNDENIPYSCFQPAFKYNESLLYRTYCFAMKKREMVETKKQEKEMCQIKELMNKQEDEKEEIYF